MVKFFAPRKAKKERPVIETAHKLKTDLLERFDRDGFLKDAKIDELPLGDIVVREQVRTKFNDDSLKELAQNIKENGLIQPLVVHREKDSYTLVCGERRYRAMNSIGIKTAPCFILENKTQKELMAVQFSENSSREALHYIDMSDGISNYRKTTRASERKITKALGISKSEVHRSLIIARMSEQMKEAAKRYDIEKYVLLEYSALEDSPLKEALEEKIMAGRLTKRSTLKKLIRQSRREGEALS